MKSSNVLCTVIAIAAASSISRAAIVNVTETGGDNEATDTITAKWSGVTYDTTIDNEPVPGTTVGTPYTVGLFMSTAPAFVDRNHQYLDDAAGLSIPAYLVGQEYIMSGNDNRDNASYILDIEVDSFSRIYMLIDNRLGGANDGTTPPEIGAGAMEWINTDGWAPMLTANNRGTNFAIPDELPFDEGADGTINQFYSVYFKDFAAGTAQVFQADNAGRNMYGVVVATIPEPSSALLLASAVGGLLARRRRR